MKISQSHIVFILFISIVLILCSSDDDNNNIDCPEINNTQPLLLGDWIFTETRIDG